MIGILARLAGVEPRPITTSPAPVVGGPHVDVYANDADSIAATSEPPPIDVDLQEIRVKPADDRPALERGVCYHQVHFEHGGRRLGALINPNCDFAALLPCPYFGPEGR